MSWENCKNILCVRPDNMGDVLMSTPAIAALKQSFHCPITLLTSSIGKEIARYIPVIDDVIVWDVPWVKGTGPATMQGFGDIVALLKSKKFDGAIIFTVFSQSPLPTALMLAMAGIPNRLAYCRENPYHLLSHWVPEAEPYSFIRHQVRRDLDLVKSIGAYISDERIHIHLSANHEQTLKRKLTSAGVDISAPWLILHPGVSEKKREYPPERWVQIGKHIATEMHYQVLVTGAPTDRKLADAICSGIGKRAYSLAGSLSLAEFITLIRLSPLLISVNTGSVHLAAAVQTKVIVLYALTNPQHAPWKATGRVLPFSVPEALQSNNEVLRFLQRHYFGSQDRLVTPEEVVEAARDLLKNKAGSAIEELVTAPRVIGSIRG